MGTELGAITYSNLSSSACSLEGYPLIQLKDSRGFLYQAQATNYTHLFDQYSTDKPTAVILKPGQKNVQSWFAWRGCVPNPKGSILVFVTLPHDTAQFLATCIDPESGVCSQTITPFCPDNITPVNQSAIDVGSIVFSNEN